MLRYVTRKVKIRTREWLMYYFGKACGSCGDCLSYTRAHVKIDCNLTAQRVSNNEAQHLDNIIAYRVYGPLSMSTRECIQ